MILCTYVYTNKYIHTCAYTHTYAYAYIHTYTYTCISTYTCIGRKARETPCASSRCDAIFLPCRGRNIAMHAMGIYMNIHMCMHLGALRGPMGPYGALEAPLRGPKGP